MYQWINTINKQALNKITLSRNRTGYLLGKYIVKPVPFPGTLMALIYPP